MRIGAHFTGLLICIGCGANPAPTAGTALPDAGGFNDLSIAPATDAEIDDTDFDGDGYSVAAGDCDDEDEEVHPSAPEIANDGIDQDCDGVDLIDETQLDQDNDGFTPQAGDCNDQDFETKPTGVEICGDGKDQNCDGEDLACNDLDADGDGFTTSNGDCDDDDKEVNPNQTEVRYNGKDDDCKVNTPDDDIDGDGVNHDKDCDDEDDERSPKLQEKPGDGKDNDCDPNTPDDDYDGDGYGATTDCNDQDKSVHPGRKEVCYNGKDDDCKAGTADNDCDGDGVPVDQDCDDKNKSINPNQPEVPYNGKDEDCDGADILTAGWSTLRKMPILQSPQLASNGSTFLAVYYDRQTTSDPYALRASLLNSTGGGVKGLKIDSGSLGPASVTSNGSNYLVVYRFKGSSGYELRAQVIKSDGSAVGSIVTVYAAATIYGRLSASYAGGRYAIAWKDKVVGATRTAVRWAGLDGGGKLVWKKGAGNDAAEYDFPVLASDGSNFLLAHSVLDAAPQTHRFVVRTVKASDGTTVSGAADLASGAAEDPRPELSFGQGNYLAVWHQATSGGGANIYGQRLDSSGTKLGQRITISSRKGDQKYARAVFCNGKHNVLFSSLAHGTFPVTTLFMQSLFAHGTLTGSTHSQNQLLYAGDTAIGWQRPACAGKRMHISAMIRPPTEHILLRRNFEP